jgi:hypothetical protein
MKIYIGYSAANGWRTFEQQDYDKAIAHPEVWAVEVFGVGWKYSSRSDTLCLAVHGIKPSPSAIDDMVARAKRWAREMGLIYRDAESLMRVAS